MTDQTRWRDQEADAFEAALLASADADAGSHSARVRSLAALASAAGHLADASASSEPSGLVVRGSFGRLPLKWLGVGAIVGLGSLAAAQGFGPRSVPSQVLSRLVPRVVARANQSKQWVPRATSTLAENRLSETPPWETSAETAALGERSDAPPAPPRRDFAAPLAAQEGGKASGKGEARRSPGLSEPRTLKEELSREVALLDQARSLLARGKPRAALAVLERRNREIESGVLGPEAKLLKVEVLLRVGNRRGAEVVAKGELARHPRGPHADRLRALLGEQKP